MCSLLCVLRGVSLVAVFSCPSSHKQADGLDAQVDKEVDSVIAELTAGLLEGAADAPTAVPEPAAPEAAAAEEAKGKEDHEGLRAMKARLESL